MDTTTTRRSERSVERATYPACSSPRSSRLASVPTIPGRRATVDTRCGPPRSSTPRMPIPGAETSTPAPAVRREEATVGIVGHAGDACGTVDILANDACGGGKISRVELKTDELIEHGLAVGFPGPLWAMQTAFRVMKAQGYGRVINICSLN